MLESKFHMWLVHWARSAMFRTRCSIFCLLLPFRHHKPSRRDTNACLYQVAKEELARECDYKLEAANQKRFRELLLDEKGLYVPLVFDEFCSTRILTTELVPGNAS